MKTPAFQFYPNDWLSSTSISLMTPAEEGGYIRLLSHMWNDENCSLPNDDSILSQLSRLGEIWLKGGCPLVRKCFIPHPKLDGRITHARLIKEREKQASWRLKSSLGGVKSSASRRCKSKGGSILVEPCLPNGINQKATLQSSSSSSNTLAKRASERSKAQQSTVGAIWIRVFKSYRYSDYKLTPKDYGAIKALGAMYPDDQRRVLGKCMEFYIQDPDPFLSKQGWPLYLLTDRINKYAAKVRQSEAPKDIAEDDE